MAEESEFKIKFEAAEVSIKEKDAKILELETKTKEIEGKAKVSDDRVKELEPVVNKLQENVKNFDSEKAKAHKEGKAEGKQEVINKMKTVIPSNSFVSGNLQGSYRVLVNDLKKKLYESENSK